MAGISMHNETDYALPEAMTQEILEPTDSGARGDYAGLRRVHEGCIGKKGATYAARFRDVMNDWGVSRFWASTDRGVAA
jgi:hypothetical protein